MTIRSSRNIRAAWSGLRRALLATAAGLLAALPLQAQEAAFPSRTVRIVIPTAPGGNHDLLARIVAEKLGAAWGQQVIVESKAGANTMLATTAVARSPADGYTVLFTLSGFVQNLVLQANPPYKSSDLLPVSLVASYPIALAAHASLPANDVTEFVKLARAQPNTMSYGSYGVGSGGHIIGEGLNKAAGIRVSHVPYKGEAASFPDLVSGQLAVVYGSVGFYARQLGTAKVKLLAVASPQRLKTFPNVPTFAEAGYPDVNLAGWGGMFLPAGTPPHIADKFVQEIRRITAMPDVQAKIFEMGFEPVGNTSAEFGQVITSDLQKWGAVARANNIKLD
jgi:tripartite-type tricarboxylate transporter receptor subunit TctC